MTQSEIIDKIANSQKKRFIFHSNQMLWYAVEILESILILRFVLKLSGANPTSPFVQLIYNVSSVLIAPFKGIYPTTNIEGTMFEWVTLVAILMYMIIAQGLIGLFNLFWPVEKRELNP